MENTSIEIVEYLKLYFKLGFKTTEDAHIIRKVKGNKITDCSAQNLFKLFKGDNLSHEIKSRREWPSVVGFDTLKPMEEPSTNTWKHFIDLESLKKAY